jgi:HK97 gp10 family phage protein
MIEAKVHGIPDLKAALASIVPKLRKRALRNALAAGARLVRDEARKEAPVLKPDMKVPYRTRGLVKKSISVRTSKIARRSGDVGVFVNVRPAKAGQRGAKNPNDPFYARFVQWGTVKMRGFHFLEAGAGQLGAALEKFKAVIGPQISKLNGGKSIDL